MFIRRLKVLWCVLLALFGATGSVWSQPRAVTLIAGGDVLLGRGMARQIARHGGDASWPFASVQSLLQRADIAFANLECPLTLEKIQTPKPIAFRAHPETVFGLQRAGFDWMNLANNHSLDCGPRGLLETMQTLKRCGINWCGAGDGKTAATPKFQTVRGLHFAWLGFSEWTIEGETNSQATIAIASDQAIIKAVTMARRRADIVIVSFHWGVEYATHPTTRQIAWAQLAARCGADVVLGAHPHVLQGFEMVRTGHRKTLIAYSLGNLVFDAARAGDRRARQTVLLRCAFNRDGLQNARLLPLIIENARPRPAARADAARILADVARLSAERKTQVRNGLVSL